MNLLPFGVFAGYASRYYVMRRGKAISEPLGFNSIGSFFIRILAILIVISPALISFYLPYVHKSKLKPLGSMTIGMAFPVGML